MTRCPICGGDMFLPPVSDGVPRCTQCGFVDCFDRVVVATLIRDKKPMFELWLMTFTHGHVQDKKTLIREHTIKQRKVLIGVGGALPIVMQAEKTNTDLGCKSIGTFETEDDADAGVNEFVKSLLR